MDLKGACLCGRNTWSFNGEFENGVEGGATTCNCTACRRYGTMWAYGHLDKDIFVIGETKAFIREGASPSLGFHFCAHCGCVCYWKSLKPKEDGSTRIAVNLRLCTEPEKIMELPIDHFEGLKSFKDLPRDGRCVKDMWF